MNIRYASNGVLCGLIASLVISWAAVAAEGPPPASAEPSKEMRAKMASVHERMAACLRSDKPIADCRREMMKSCQKLLGEHGCPMMGMHDGMMNDGMMNDGMMKGPTSDAPKDK